jgi:hypothetical protein
MNNLPANVYRVRQRDFAAIAREPWVYWIPDDLRHLFASLPSLEDVAEPKLGMTTSNNFRFVRGWWEVGRKHIGFGCHDAAEAQETGKRWFPYMKGGGYRKWYGNQHYIVDWANNGELIKSARSYPRAKEYYFREGITYSFLTSLQFNARYFPEGFIFDVAGSSIFTDEANVMDLLAIVNSNWARFVLQLINPTVNYQVGDLARLPVLTNVSGMLQSLTRRAIFNRLAYGSYEEISFDFISPPSWAEGLSILNRHELNLETLETQIDKEIYRLYDISEAHRAAIEAELAGEPLPTDEDEIEAILNDDGDDEVEPPVDREELAVRWISYAVGIVLGRFKVGAIDDSQIEDRKSKIANRPLGSAVYYREDFAVGSLPAPSEEEFDELVGPPERFAYVDEAGGRHVFPAEVEAALQDLAVDDGITVLDEDHPRDLPTLVEKALRLMLDFRLTVDDLRLDREGEGDLVNRKSKIVNRPSEEVIRIGASGDLRKFLTKVFFTDWHIKWYNIPYQAKAPVYWPLQSANRRYGFVLFHEKIDKTTLYTLQRDYLDYKIKGLQQRIGDLTVEMDGLQGSQRKAVARDVAKLRETLTEVEAFAKTMARIVREGYEPDPNWIDDRIILRMAPLWELVPLWEKYPKKHWKRLQKGEYDWSHIALHYWPERVREACRENKSYAIAHGHPEWYDGT